MTCSTKKYGSHVLERVIALVKHDSRTSRISFDAPAFQPGRAAKSSSLTPLAARSPADVLTYSKSLSCVFFFFASASMPCPATPIIAALDFALLKSRFDATEVANASA